MHFEAFRKQMFVRLHRDRRLTLTDLRTAFHLLMPANGTGLAYLSLASLAKLADASVPDVQHSVARLQGFGYFKAWNMPHALPVSAANAAASAAPVQTTVH
jgi:hypothetical protein